MPTGQMGAVQSLDISITPPVPEPLIRRQAGQSVGPPAGFPAVSDPAHFYVSDTGFDFAPPLPTVDNIFATALLALGGVLHTGDHINMKVGGNTVVYTLVGGDSTFVLLAAHVAAALNADGTVGPLINAVSDGVTSVNVTSKVAGPAGMLSLSVTVTGLSNSVTAAWNADEMQMAANAGQWQGS